MYPPQPHQPRRLVGTLITPNSAEFRELLSWSYPSEPFYVDQVRRALHESIPQLVLFQSVALWAYHDADETSALVAFGTLQITDEYSRDSGGLEHCYIPLLSAKPGAKGYGPAIVEHLTAEAAILVNRTYQGRISNRLFLDVYQENTPASGLYTRCGFTRVNPDRLLYDEKEGNQPYFVMAKSLEVTLPPPPPRPASPTPSRRRS